MKDIVEQILASYLLKMREPKMEELKIEDSTLLEERGCCFVTLFLKGEIHGSAGNIKEIEENIVAELLSNTMQALTSDKRFSPLKLEEIKELKYRIDFISERKIISENDIKNLNPVKHGVIAIKRDYSKLAVILPNISSKILVGSDLLPVLQKKLTEKKFVEKDFILYSIETKVESNY